MILAFKAGYNDLILVEKNFIALLGNSGEAFFLHFNYNFGDSLQWLSSESASA